jgi:hypothetical protein
MAIEGTPHSSEKITGITDFHIRMLLEGTYGLPPEKRPLLETAKHAPRSQLGSLINNPEDHIKGFVFRDPQPVIQDKAGRGVFGEIYMGDGRFKHVDVYVYPPSLAMKALSRIMRSEPKGYVTISEHWPV